MVITYIYRTWQNIGGVKYWRMPPYEIFGGNKLANHQNCYNYIKVVLSFNASAILI